MPSWTSTCCKSMGGSKGFNAFWIFLADKGSEDPSTTKSGPSLAHHRNTISMVFRWRADVRPNIECWLCSFVIFHGSRTRIDKAPYSFKIFQEGEEPEPCLIRDFHECQFKGDSNIVDMQI